MSTRKPRSDAEQAQPAGRPPDYVIVTWQSAQLRDKIQRTGPSPAEVLHAFDPDPPEPGRPPVADLEAEP